MTRDRETDRPRGIAYVDFEDAESLRKAIELDGEEFAGRAIRLDVAENKRWSQGWWRIRCRQVRRHRRRFQLARSGQEGRRGARCRRPRREGARPRAPEGRPTRPQGPEGRPKKRPFFK
ncbi:uncharacterized protein ACA1_011040 [Acanthamoeba castellanii str. Neff]|uniref:RRM domain-containing protein n=1 Tax=Acanthamoeba castellanii (strain ATCC 30010 / Neff) TaxID=1257118 RepID=L8GIK4_ACACF|nr:uncharacterized protein ACA1_011040 [Acanthamoeba castellanii str. Neff]ELR12006.1 hypothetical protein ACA1_011040 [Acanthamoeba castellanii str. Neff]